MDNFLHDVRTAEAAAQKLRIELGLTHMNTVHMMGAFKKFIAARGWTLKIIDYDDCDENKESWVDPNLKVVFVRSDVWEAARLGQGRACFTLAEEMAHIECGHKHVRHRKSEYSAAERAHDNISTDERYAKQIAGAFLMPAAQIADGSSSQDVAILFGISLSAAEFRLKELVQAGVVRRQKRELPASVVDFLAEGRARGVRVTSI
jgi:Zn-dependent peptidase ImmA (M78 family)